MCFPNITRKLKYKAHSFAKEVQLGSSTTYGTKTTFSRRMFGVYQFTLRPNVPKFTNEHCRRECTPKPNARIDSRKWGNELECENEQLM